MFWRNAMKEVQNCESCVYFDYNADTDTDECMINLDEDEFERYINGKYKECPYYKLYDEYKMVQKQN